MTGPTKADLVRANAELHDLVQRYEAQLKAFATERDAERKQQEVDPEALALSRCIKAIAPIAPIGNSYETNVAAKRAAVRRVLDHLTAMYLGGAL